MTPERWLEVERVYHSAQALSGSERAAHLTQACGGDADLRAEVESLLSHADAPSPLTKGDDGPTRLARMADASSLIGRRIGSYQVDAWLGAGGMGVVFRAHDTRLGRSAALKVLPPLAAHDPGRLLRFEREARALAALKHPNIATVYGLEDSSDVQAIAMELVEGDTLDAILKRNDGRGLPLDRALSIAEQIAAALDAAHERGVIHRDLKPANIAITPDGVVKVLDFGLARIVSDGDEPDRDPSSDSSALPEETQAGMVLGTAAYMSPEQAAGRPIDKRSDIWAFGCVLYQMLSGRLPAGDPALEALPSPTPDAVRRIVRRCLERQPKDRLRDIGDARADLLEARASEHRPAVRQSIPETRTTWSATTVAGLVVLTGLVVWTSRVSPPAPPVTTRFPVATPSSQPFQADFWGNVAMSADGSRYLFRTRGGLLVRSRDGRPDVTLPADEGSQHPFFSPDGEWVFYGVNDGLKKVRAIGGTATRVATTMPGAVGRWTPDGILFTSAAGLFRVDEDGGTPVPLPLATLGPNEQAAFPEPLPGGETVLVTVVPTRASEVPLTLAADSPDARVDAVNLRTGARKTLIRAASGARYVPTGHLLYLSSGRLHAVKFDASRLEVSGTGVAITDERGTSDFAVSDDGSLITLHGVVQAGAYELMWVDRQGQQTPVGAPLRSYIYPEFSPDGTRLGLVLINTPRVDRDVWIWNLARQTLEVLTNDPADNPSIAWSLDSQRIAFGSGRRGGVSSVFWQAANGTGTAQALTDGSSVALPITFAPDGLLLSVDSPGEARNITVMTMGLPRQVRPVVTGPASELSADISPNGRWLAFDSNETGQYEIYVRPYPDAARQRWTISSTGGRQPVWSPDGRELFYRDFTGAVFAVPVTTEGPSLAPGKAVKLFEGTGFTGGGSSGSSQTYDISPDGRRFVMIKVPGPSQPALTVMVNWFSELTRLVPR
ncbi:MAG: protein kinase [Vicinamibacterales bacterium]